METPMTNHDAQQLIPMSNLSPEENTTVAHEINKPLTTELKQQTLVLRLFSLPVRILTSLHLPRFSDGTLRIIFLIFIALIGLSSFMVALIVGSTVVQFKDQCLLYATFQYQSFVTRDSNWTVRIIPLSERFSPQSTCDFCTFYNVFTFIYCIMTGFFFILFNGDNRIMATNDRCLIIPWFPISVILGFFSLINASILTNGFLKFCSTITSNDHRVTSCTQLNQFFFEQYPNVVSLFAYMLLGIVVSWFQLAFFVAIIAVLTIRLSSSFDWNTNAGNNEANITMKSMEQT